MIALVFLPSITNALPSPANEKKGNEGIGLTYECVDEKGIVGNCDFDDFIGAIKKVVNYAVTLVLFLSVIAIVIAGFKFMISGDKPAERDAAKEILRKVAMGLFFILAAWLIVTLIMNALVDSEKIPSLLSN